MPITYTNGKIYKIKGLGDDCFIGSTVDHLSSKMNAHRMGYISFLQTGKGDCAVYILFTKYGVENCKIELVENYSANKREELNLREDKIIAETANTVNYPRIIKDHNYFNKILNKKYLISSECACGGKISVISNKIHLLTLKHINFMQFKNEEKQFLEDEANELSDEN